ncbi:unnamed protein product [Schistocephalus solidus]|uniref:Reverse transcriptase domain-containing protein n=1 Tax=Schistocephalus solidus TaxID=70667 RepID=A0A183T9F6_SCHSO|nr:unnamed protein product [Schistocephalus solidus]
MKWILTKKNFQTTSNDPVIEDLEFTEEDVKKEILAINDAKSPGPDQIPAKILNELASELTRPLSCISQSYFDRGILAFDLKSANIYPIHKGVTRTSAKNYRLVSLT